MVLRSFGGPAGDTIWASSRRQIVVNREIGFCGQVAHSAGLPLKTSASCVRKAGAWSTAVCQPSGQWMPKF
jgi:hypothetical protein